MTTKTRAVITRLSLGIEIHFETDTDIVVKLDGNEICHGVVDQTGAKQLIWDVGDSALEHVRKMIQQGVVDQLRGDRVL
jgi:hypothetical protein